MMLVSPLVHVSQKQPFEEADRPLIKRSPEVERRSDSAECCSGEIEVYINVYDATHGSVIHQINDIFAHSMSPLKLGGLFHVGVEVMGVEWAYGWAKCGSGVTHGRPRSEVHHRFRETVCLSKTQLSHKEIEDVIHDLMNDYRGRDYNLVENNCCHFAEDFCQRLGNGSFPAWVQRLGRGYDGLQKAARSLSALGVGPSSYSLEPSKMSARRSKNHSRSKGITGSRSTRKEILCM